MGGHLERPALQLLLEAVAEVMGLDHGQQRLELVFEDGTLRTWFTHVEKRPPGELHRFDGRLAGRLRPLLS